VKTLLSLGIAFFVSVISLLIGHELTPHLNVEIAGGILTMAFIGTAVISWLVLKYRGGRTSMIRRILISLGVGVVNLAFLYGTLFGPDPERFGKDAAIDVVVSASLASVVTFVLLSLPIRLPDEWRRATISLSVAFFAAVFINVQIICFAEEAKNLKSIFAGVFIGAAVVTLLLLRRWGRHR
jgi:hypothetical protein